MSHIDDKSPLYTSTSIAFSILFFGGIIILGISIGYDIQKLAYYGVMVFLSSFLTMPMDKIMEKVYHISKSKIINLTWSSNDIDNDSIFLVKGKISRKKHALLSFVIGFGILIYFPNQIFLDSSPNMIIGVAKIFSIIGYIIATPIMTLYISNLRIFIKDATEVKRCGSIWFSFLMISVPINSCFWLIFNHSEIYDSIVSGKFIEFLIVFFITSILQLIPKQII
jgi:hypothetical protein